MSGILEYDKEFAFNTATLLQLLSGTTLQYAT
jgi:hypothetical protein